MYTYKHTHAQRCIHVHAFTCGCDCVLFMVVSAHNVHLYICPELDSDFGYMCDVDIAIFMCHMTWYRGIMFIVFCIHGHVYKCF